MSAKAWLTVVAVAVALVLAAAGGCDKNVDLGVEPVSDAGVDAADAAAGN